MTDYSKTVDFAAKDALASGNPAKVAKGVEINTELVNIQTAVATKYDDGDTVRAASGVVATPGISFNSDVDTGLYSAGVNALGFAAGGVESLEVQNGFVIVRGVGTQLLNVDGTAALPSYTFGLDNDTGFYRVGANEMRAVSGGVFAWGIQTAGGVTQTYVGDGLVGFPSITFGSDPDTGIYRDGANTVGIAAAGARVGQFSATGLDSVARYFSADGSVGAPAYTYTSDPDTGLSRPGSNTINVSTGGVLAWQFASTIATNRLTLYNPDGAVGTPSYTFENDIDTGIYRAGANDMWLVAGGAQIAEFHSSGAFIRLLDSNVGSPSISWLSDTDTGFYRDTANQIAVSLGGVTAGQIVQGTFTLTLVNITGSPTITASYQRWGKIVVITATTGATAAATGNMGFSGIPAIIRPTTQAYGTISGLAKNSGLVVGYAQIANTGATTSVVDATGVVINTGVCGLDNGFNIQYMLN